MTIKDARRILRLDASNRYGPARPWRSVMADPHPAPDTCGWCYDRRPWNQVSSSRKTDSTRRLWRRSPKESVRVRRKFRTRGNVFVIAFTVFAGLLWAGVIDAEMKWTATMFGLALAAIFVGDRD
jgi:hypothetical protein